MNVSSALGRGLVVTAMVFVAGCGGPKTVNTDAVAANVMSTINGPGSVKVESVDCPSKEKAEAGKTFTCHYELTDGSVGEITITVADQDGTARWDVSRPASGQAEQQVLTDYEDQTGKDVRRVKYPDPLKGGTKAKTTCTMRLATGETRKVTVTFNGGKIRWRT